jgi:hypothetical protein
MELVGSFERFDGHQVEVSEPGCLIHLQIVINNPSDAFSGVIPDRINVPIGWIFLTLDDMTFGRISKRRNYGNPVQVEAVTLRRKNFPISADYITSHVSSQRGIPVWEKIDMVRHNVACSTTAWASMRKVEGS